ncbi:MAG: hypothetical protein HYY06_08675, partial [Deltaproteobacteria bacterium]|nr:hypothetical protein [Deltaproteobacteria bacterium]
FQSSFYAGAHAALNALGEAEIERLIDESLSVWGRFQTVIEDAGADAMSTGGTTTRVRWWARTGC